MLYCLGATSAVSLDPPFPGLSRETLLTMALTRQGAGGGVVGVCRVGWDGRGIVAIKPPKDGTHIYTHTHTQARAHTLEMRACFIMTSFEHCTSRQCPITHHCPSLPPTATKYPPPLPMASPGARSKRSHN